MNGFHPFRLVAELRPHLSCTVFSAPVRVVGQDELQEHRFVVWWDEDEDIRVLPVIAAFYFSAPREFRFVHSYGERKARLTVQQLGFREDVQQALRSVLDSDSVGAAIGNDWFDLEVDTNFLPPRDASPLVEAALALLRAKPSQEAIAALPLIAPTGSEVAERLAHFQNDGAAKIDSSLAAIHQLFRLGSFGLPYRPWPSAQSE